MDGRGRRGAAASPRPAAAVPGRAERQIRTVTKEGALAALAASKPGAARQRDYELEAAKAENARLSEALKEMAVRLTLVEGKRRWG